MYSTCIFCNSALGKNESIEHFPVGRKLAFDAARGRLWVVCPSCARWNLTPLESRWEAIEEAERAFVATKLRASTEHIGLAKLREGTSLIRIGRPQLPEFAAWRYADVFTRRHRRTIALGALPGVLQMIPMIRDVVPTSVLPIVLGATSVMYAGLLGVFAYQGIERRRGRLHVRDDDGQRLLITRGDAAFARIVRHARDESWHLRVSHRPLRAAGPLGRLLGLRESNDFHASYTDVHGTVALRALASILPSANHGGAPKGVVAQAVGVIEKHGSALAEMRETSRLPREVVRDSRVLSELHAPTRLALEMMLHEHDERRALDGELRELEDRWREAEEIANIADNMFVPTTVGAELARLRSKKSEESA